MQFKLQLAVYDKTDKEKLIPIAEYYKLRCEGKIIWEPFFENFSIFLFHQGKEWLASEWNFGSLELLVLQFEVASERLSVRKEAIIRSGVLGGIGVPYLLFEPIGEEEISISLFFIEDYEISSTFPIEKISGSSEELYKYVQDNRKELLEGRGNDEYFKNLSCQALELINALKRQARIGRQLFKLLGKKIEN